MEYPFADGTRRHNRRVSHAGAARASRQPPAARAHSRDLIYWCRLRNRLLRFTAIVDGIVLHCGRQPFAISRPVR
jgi:hypothetical protein